MMLKTTVIINEVTNLSDARYCAGMGVDYIGFRIDNDHDKYIDSVNYKEITEWISGIKFIGETSNKIDQDSLKYEVDLFLIDQIELLSKYNGKPVLWSISIEEVSKYLSIIKEHQSKTKGIILTKNTSEVSEKEIEIITSLSADFDIYLGYGVNSGNVLKLIDELPIKGVSIKGGDEIRPGYKDYDELADILELLEEEH